MAGRSLISSLKRVIQEPGAALRLAGLHAGPLGMQGFRDPAVKLMVRSCWGEKARQQPTEVFPGIEDVPIQLERPFDRVLGTNVSPLEIMILCGAARLLNVKRLVEIGTFNGNTTLNLALNMPEDSVVHTVTLEEPTEFELQYRGTSCESRIVQHFEDSTTIDWNKFGPPVDMIFIDGAHETPFVQSDTKNALEIIKRPGGVIFWHDYATRLDVARVVDSLDPSIPATALTGTQLAVARF